MPSFLHIASSGPSLPAHSIDFEANSSQYLSMSDANFGAFNYGKFAISMWYKMESSGTFRSLFSKGNNSTDNSFWVEIGASGTIAFISSANGSSTNMFLRSSTTTHNDSNWHHALFVFDYANATSSERGKIIIDGSEVTYGGGTNTKPNAAVYDSAQDMRIGVWLGGAAGKYDGLIYQAAVFSGTIPSIGDLYDAGSPKDISGLSGLYSYLDVAGGTVTNDAVLATGWTNNNTATPSTTIPS